MKPDGACCPEFAVKLRIPAPQAVLTQVDLVLHAFIAGFDLRVVGAAAHVKRLLVSSNLKWLSYTIHRKVAKNAKKFFSAFR